MVVIIRRVWYNSRCRYARFLRGRDKGGMSMQAVYAAYYPAAKEKKANMLTRHFKQKDYLERSQKRSPYDDASSLPPARPDNGNKRGPRAGALYMIITVLLLTVLYPVGLFFLWARKLKWSISVKLLLTVITAVVFCALVVFAINYDTDNQTIKDMQSGARSALEKVNEYTGDSVDSALKWCEEKYLDGKQNALDLWDAVEPRLAKQYIKLYDRVDDNIYAMRAELPALLLDKYKRAIDYKEPVKPAKELVKQATPDSGVSVTLAPTFTPAPTATPTPTPSPTPTPVPVMLPAIKDAGLAPVFFTPNGVYYHATENCSGMMNAVSHTLLEAREAGKQVCDTCEVTPYSMIDSDHYLWVDDELVAHTSDECLEFAQGRYALLPFEEVYAGSYTYCEACGGSTCLAYIRQHESQFAVSYEDLDELTRKLYEYEKTITVYYGTNSRKYHANAECMYMVDDKYKHTLYQALHADNKQRCELCQPPSEEDARAEMDKVAS